MAGKVGPKRTQGTQGDHMAYTRRTHADKVWRRGQSALKADTRRTDGGQAPETQPEHIAANLFSKREPHGKLFEVKLVFAFPALRA